MCNVQREVMYVALSPENSEMINGLLVKLQSDVARLMEKNSEMTNDSLAELMDEVSHLRKGIMPIQLLNKWRPFKENEYYFTSIRCPWSDAEKLCERKNSKLVVINSQEEQEYIRMNANCDRWIGLHDRAKNGTWRWVDGTDYASNVKFWANGEPNGTGGVDEDCALVGENGLWHARPCKTWLFLICEKRAD
ncbi:hepatic lectin-like [Hypanus sabinus]|uniref:hepatic lectin-like n=1 Tax=Hypanus sabinus TaxID=79690 RepID=UPI0028C4037E|nr:hepatic lectin-like [Hypanus sabinus]